MGITVLHGQPSIRQAYARLQQQYGPANRQDTGYIKELVRLADVFVFSSPDSVVVLIEDIERNAVGKANRFARVDALRLRGDFQQALRNYDEAARYYQDGLQLAREEKGGGQEITLLSKLGNLQMNKGAYADALRYFFDALKLAEKAGDNIRLSSVQNNIANTLYYQHKFDEALAYYKKGLALSLKNADSLSVAIAYNNIGGIYLVKKEYTEALHYFEKVLALNVGSGYPELILSAYTDMASAYAALDSLALAGRYYEKVMEGASINQDALYIAHGSLGKARLLVKKGNLQEALTFAMAGLKAAKDIGQKNLVRDAYELLATVYAAMGQGMQAYESHRNFKLYADSLNNLESERATAMLEAEYNYSQRELQFQRTALQQRWIIFSAFAGVFSLGIILFAIVRNRNRLNRANKQLMLQKREIEQQHKALEQTLTDLRATQQQLIHSEKMASLGELTAGVAHEIQNPLNFVNNFAGVSGELIGELEEAIEKGDKDEAVALIADVKSNLEKIEQHGKRADGIVKSMLYHSRTGAGKPEPTKINKLCEEYFNLSYHGMRARDKSFNAAMVSQYDENVGEVSIIPQDMGRVILNLLNNAFYAVNQRAKAGEEGYQPQVKLETLRKDNEVWISVTDNGLGIPEDHLAKIFQPFFSTKPTGTGTGLGLSISYDIVTKAHGGQLQVESASGKGTTFVIKLPVHVSH